MKQVTVDLDGDTEARPEKTEWPQSVRESAGAWPDLPGREQLRQQQGEDIPREPF